MSGYIRFLKKPILAQRVLANAGSEMMRVASINLYRERFLLIGLVYDAMLAECNAEEAEFVAHRVGEVMQLGSAVLP